jgi:hypothetical protein
MKIRLISMLLLFIVFPLFSQDNEPRNENMPEKKIHFMTGLSFSASCFDYFSAEIGINIGTYRVFAGHFSATTYGALLEY